VWGLEAETDSMSPSVGRLAVSGHMVASAIFDPLITIDADGHWQPYLAESLTPNTDNTVWDIKVRPGISFHDGEPLDAAAVVKNLRAGQSSIITGKAMVLGQVDRRHRRHDRADHHHAAVGQPAHALQRPGRLHRRPQAGRRLPRWQPPDRHRSLHVQGVGEERPLHRHPEPGLLA
jgi:hypothetical protein